MKWNNVFFFFFILFPVFCFSLEKKDITLYLPFENDLEPEISPEKTEIKFSHGSKEDVIYEKGIKGNGLNISKIQIRYISSEIFSKKEGTVAFWITPVGWGAGDAKNHYFVTLWGDNCYVLIYKLYTGNTWVYVEGKKEGKKQKKFVGGRWDSYESGKWVFMAFTFKEGEQCFYINGKLVGREVDDLIELEFIKSCMLEVNLGLHIIDEIIVFKRALTPVEIEAIYHINLNGEN